MYSLGGVRRAYQALWDAVVREVPGLPPLLTWPDDVHASWADDAVIVKQTCGWPLVTRLDRSVGVVGAFAHDVAGAAGHRYRSVIVSKRSEAPGDVASARPAVNSFDSLSGWVSLVAWSGRPVDALRADAVESGSHVGSLQLLRDGHAEVASIDAVTFAHVERHWPVLRTGLEVVGEGPLVPSLPVVVPAAERDLIEPLRRAFVRIVAIEAMAPTLAALRIAGFVPLGVDDYRRDLEPFAGVVGS